MAKISEKEKKLIIQLFEDKLKSFEDRLQSLEDELSSTMQWAWGNMDNMESRAMWPRAVNLQKEECSIQDQDYNEVAVEWIDEGFRRWMLNIANLI